MCIEILGDGRSIIKASGEIDVSNAGQFMSAIESALAHSPGGFIIDLSDVSYIDSAGVAAIMFAYRQVQPDGRLALVATNRNVKGILALIHTERLPGLCVLDDLQSAEHTLTDPT